MFPAVRHSGHVGAPRVSTVAEIEKELTGISLSVFCLTRVPYPSTSGAFCLCSSRAWTRLTICVRPATNIIYCSNK